MRFLRLTLCGGLLLLGLLVWNSLRRPSALRPARMAPGIARTAVTPGSASSAEPAGVTDEKAAISNILTRLAYAQRWERELPPELAAFRDWARRYQRTAPAGRAELEAEGMALARARRPAMRDLIVRDPQVALAMTVPAAVRQQLPASVLAELEMRVSGTGDVGWRASTPEPGSELGGPSLRRMAFLNGATYSAHVYGRREAQLGKEGASLHGIALDGEFAVHENPLRVLEPGEIPPGSVAANCPVSDLAVEPPRAEAGVNLASLEVVEAHGRTFEFCGGAMMLEKFEQRLLAEESGPSARVQASSANTGGANPPATAADAPTANTLGTKRALVVRVDTADFPGEPITVEEAQSTMDDTVRINLETFSYGQVSLITTVAPKVYRLGRAGTSYALAGDQFGLYADALAAMGADYDPAKFDYVIVVHPRLGPLVVSGSQITYGGSTLAVGGSKVLINGSPKFAAVTHELGHCLGLLHANLWKVSDGNALSSTGFTVEYGDPFDTMADPSHAFSGVQDTRHHFNQWQKNRLGWLPDNRVTNVTTSGTYRIYRFDSQDALAVKQPLALRILRDGVRWFWVGYRQSFTTNPSLMGGASVVWGFNSPQQSQLLDLTTPGNNAYDCALAIGTALTDPVSGVTIKPVAQGGTDPALWLDVEVTVPATPPNEVIAWGRMGAAFFTADTGTPANPTPETYVPFGLTNVQAIVAGDLHALALKSDGTVVAWGDNTNGQINVPAAAASDVVGIAAGGNTSGVVKRDGTVVLWGESLGGVTTPPAGLSNVRQLAIGGLHSDGIYHALALKNDGTVVGWGDNTRGDASPPAGLNNVIAIAASDGLSVALKSDGTVVRWGTTFPGSVPFPAGLSDVVAIASSGTAEHALALKSDGTVVAWGLNNFGQATVPAGLNNVIAIATGAVHSLALKADGSVVGWGYNGNGQLNIPSGLPRGYLIAASDRTSFMLAGPHLYLTAQPVGRTVTAGETATLSVGAIGSGSIGYQWRKDGTAIPGATSSTLTVPNTTANSAGNYDVIVRDGVSAFTTPPVRLTVNTVGAEVARITHLSIRTNAGPAAQTLIVGFTVGGAGTSGAKPLLLRGIGPTLSAFGVTGVLADPKLELYNSTSAKIQENDNWGGAASLSTAFSAVGAFPLSDGNSRDAALFNPGLNPGGYSAQVSGVGGATGVALAEIYDSSTNGANFTTTTPRLINISARTVSGTGANRLIAGFNLAGPTAKTVLIRAIGPTLAAFGVTGVLLDPKLELYNSTNVKIQENDNWGGTTTLANAFTAVGAFPLDGSSKDAALVVTLQPGAYTAQVSGAGNTTGVALVEIYEMP